MLVALVPAIDIGPLDGDTGQPLDLFDLPSERVTVIGTAGQGLHAKDELPARGARVGDRDRCLDPELVARSRLALGDAFYLGRVQGIELAGVVCLLGEDARHALTGDGKGGLEFFLAGNLAADVAVE